MKFIRSMLNEQVQNNMKNKYEKGYSLVELIVVMAILGILGTMLVTMMSTGGRLYKNANTIMEEQSDARLAMSYISMRIRQNDVQNNINIEDVNIDGKSYRALTIVDSTNSDRAYWLYFDTNKLKELVVSSSSASSSDIAEVSDFKIKKLPGVLDMPTTILMEITTKNSTISLNQELTLRTPQKNLTSEN